MTSSNNPSRADALAGWPRMAAAMIAVAEALAAVASADKRNGPQIIALALLCRSVGHLRAVNLLIEAKQIVEARTIARNLFENLFLAVALKDDGANTVKKLEDDHRFSRSQRGKLIADNTKTFSENEIALVKAYMKTLGKGKMLRPSDLAKVSEVKNALSFYAQLSGDSAHPSFDSLERHIEKDAHGGIVGVSFVPVLEPDEPADTVGWACTAMHGILLAIRDVTDASGVDPQMKAVGDAFRDLVKQLSDD